MRLNTAAAQKNRRAMRRSVQILIAAGIDALPLPEPKTADDFEGIDINGETANVQYNGNGNFINARNIHPDVDFVAVYCPHNDKVTVWRRIVTNVEFWELEIVT